MTRRCLQMVFLAIGVSSVLNGYSGSPVADATASASASATAATALPDKKVVWALRDWDTLGPASNIQLLDEPGVAENGDLQR